MAYANAINVHAIVYAWPRVHRAAFEIAKSLTGHVERVSIVLCTDDPFDNPDSIDVHVLGNSCYFGSQFERTVRIFAGDILLQIAADTETDSWPGLARHCAKKFVDQPRLGIWAPQTDWSAWHGQHTELMRMRDSDLVAVWQTDCIVWAIRREIVEFMKTLDYSVTPLGWGIDWAAISRAYATGFFVARDSEAKIRHPKGSGYDHHDARIQEAAFLRTLPHEERIQLELLKRAQRTS